MEYSSFVLRILTGYYGVDERVSIHPLIGKVIKMLVEREMEIDDVTPVPKDPFPDFVAIAKVHPVVAITIGRIFTGESTLSEYCPQEVLERILDETHHALCPHLDSLDFGRVYEEENKREIEKIACEAIAQAIAQECYDATTVAILERGVEEVEFPRDSTYAV